MEILVYAIVFSLILIVSNATNKLIPTLPLPLIQIVLGIGIGFLLPNSEYHLDTELFLALVIWTITLSRSRRSRYYLDFEALAHYCLFNLPSHFYFDP